MMKPSLLSIFPLAFLYVLPGYALACSDPSGSLQVQPSQTGHYITDLVLHRRWAVIVDCSHPERPWTLREVAWENALHVNDAREIRQDMAAHKIPLIRSGMRVRLWSNAGGSNIELTGTALQSGDVGEAIHVRIGSHATVVEGKVRGAGSVELSTPSKWQEGRSVQ